MKWRLNTFTSRIRCCRSIARTYRKQSTRDICTYVQPQTALPRNSVHSIPVRQSDQVVCPQPTPQKNLPQRTVYQYFHRTIPIFRIPPNLNPPGPSVIVHSPDKSNTASSSKSSTSIISYTDTPTIMDTDALHLVVWTIQTSLIKYYKYTAE